MLALQLRHVCPSTSSARVSAGAVASTTPASSHSSSTGTAMPSQLAPARTPGRASRCSATKAPAPMTAGTISFIQNIGSSMACAMSRRTP
jgi:hypothetical protein